MSSGSNAKGWQGMFIKRADVLHRTTLYEIEIRAQDTLEI